jgi:hypothetical protein
LGGSRPRRYGGSPGRQRGKAAGANEPFGYDLRRGAAAYAPIVGTVGGFVVTGVVLVFGIASHHKAGQPVEHAAMLGRATALLVLGLIACLLAAFALAAIGAERRLTPNLTAAALYAGVCTAIGIVAILGAFEVLAKIYLAQTLDLFALITGGTAVAAVVLVALVLGDAWTTEGLPRNHWLSTQSKAAWWATAAAGTGALFLGAVMLLYFDEVRIRVGDHGLHWVIGAGIIVALLSALGAMFRSMHARDGKGRSIRKDEALAALVVMNGYLAIFLLIMP